MSGIVCLVVAGIVVVLMVFAPALMRLRVRILGAAGLTRLAGYFEQNLAAGVIITRVAMAVVVVLLVLLGLRAA